MIRSRSIECVAFVGLLASFCPEAVWGAAIVWVPPSLNVGDTYHLVFVTSGTRQATTSDITNYNSFVDNAIGALDDASIHGDIVWKCIGSVAGTDARDNIGYASSTAPVYLLNGTRAANNSTEFWDADTTNLNAPINVSETLGTVADEVWTGSSSDGSASGNPLGSGSVTTGSSSGITGAWMSSWVRASNSTYHVYGFSEELTAAVPEPGTLLLAALSLAAGGTTLRCRRRRTRKPK